MSLAPVAAGAGQPVGAPTTPAPSPPDSTPAVAATPSPAASGPQSALARMVAEAATRQDGLASLLANLPVAVATSALADTVRTIAAQLLAAQAPLDGRATAADLRAAAQNSGLFLEANLAATGQPDPAAPQGPASDLKALLLQLIASLGDVAPAHGQAPRAPPPTAGGALAGQPPAEATLAPGLSPEAMAQALSRQAQAALARVQLSQAASLSADARWAFEAPVATPQGAGVAQFEISRDDRGAGAAAASPTWRARFSIDAPPSGPVHAELSLSGGRLRLTLTAEDEGARQALQAGRDELTGELAAGHDADVAVRFVTGAPPRAALAAGRVVDRRT